MTREPVHPGDRLREDFLVPLRLTRSDLARELDVPVKLVDGLLSKRAKVDEALAYRLARAFRTSPKYWENLQEAWDKWKADGQGKE